MDGLEHKLILDYQNSTFQARCSCGGWEKAPVSIKSSTLHEVYDRIEDEHCRHVEEAETYELSLV